MDMTTAKRPSMEANPKVIGARIRTFRQKVRMSQQELSYVTHISTNSISRIERGEVLPSIPSLKKITDALGVDITDILCNHQ